MTTQRKGKIIERSLRHLQKRGVKKKKTKINGGLGFKESVSSRRIPSEECVVTAKKTLSAGECSACWEGTSNSEKSWCINVEREQEKGDTGRGGWEETGRVNLFFSRLRNQIKTEEKMVMNHKAVSERQFSKRSLHSVLHFPKNIPPYCCLQLGACVHTHTHACTHTYMRTSRMSARMGEGYTDAGRRRGKVMERIKGGRGTLAE